MASIRLKAMGKLFSWFFFVFCILASAVESADDGNRIACYPLNGNLKNNLKILIAEFLK